MSKPQIPLLGRIALQLKLISMEQLSAATRQQGESGGEKRLGEILVERGVLSAQQLELVLRTRQQLIAKQRAKAALAETLPAPEPGAAAAAPRPAPAAARPPAREPEEEPRPSDASPGTSPELLALLRRGVEAGASDIHVHAGSPLRLRLHGRFEATEAPIAPEAAERMLRSALSPEQQQRFEAHGEIDFAWSVRGLGRFRVNFYRQLRGMDGVFRSIPERVPTLADLGLPTSLAKFTNYHQGMVLVTGPANCGKSSTLAALVDLINEARTEHILTVEDPIEVLHPPKRCVVNQRTVGPHTGSFARALRAALREDPDVIVIGELRDLETISLALTAAETGHLVLATLHTSGAIRTVNRITGAFPADQQEQIRSMVSESLRAVISQRLVPAADGQRRVPALELLVNNKAVGNMIRENKTFQLQSVMQMGATQGMCLLDDSLAKLVKEKVVTRDEALRHCEDPRRIP
jgi:twitching motility protein PilT